MDYTKYIDQGILIANEFVKAHGQTAWDTVLLLVVVSALQFLAVGFISLAIAVFCWEKFRQHIIKSQVDLEDHVPYFLAYGGVGALTTFVSFINLLDIWNWMMVFYPELYLAKQAMDKVLS